MQCATKSGPFKRAIWHSGVEHFQRSYNYYRNHYIPAVKLRIWGRVPTPAWSRVLCFFLRVTLFSLFSEEIICNEVIRWDSHKVLVHTCEFQKFEENDISIHIIHRWWRSWAFLSRFQLPNHLTWSRLVPPPCPSEPHHLVCRKWGEGLSGDSVTDRESIRDLFVVNGQIAILEVGIFYDWWVETTHTACIALGRSGTSPNETKREPFRTVFPIWGQTIQIPSELPGCRDVQNLWCKWEESKIKMPGQTNKRARTRDNSHRLR